jgi:hypothetical protein
MKIQARYDNGYTYTWECDDDVKIGDEVYDGCHYLTVVDISDGGYKGELRKVRKVKSFEIDE